MTDNEFRIDTPYLPGEKGCRMIWAINEDEEKIIYLRNDDLKELEEILENGSTAKIELEDGASSILVNSDVTDFFLDGEKHLKIETLVLKVALKQFLENYKTDNN